MQYSWKTYGILAIILTVSFLLAWILPTTDILRSIYGLPGIGAMLFALYQIYRDHAAYEKALALQRDQQHFVLGITSHMAEVAFDKHVEFCEKYISRMQQGLTELFQKGPTKACLKFRNELSEIRLSFRTWLTSDMQLRIMPCEEAIQKIGVSKLILEDLPVGDKRSKVVEEISDTFSDVLGIQRIRGANNEEVAPARIMDHLQELLGVKELARLRSALVNKAVRTLEMEN